MSNAKPITVQTVVDAKVEIVWKKWTSPEDIIQWNNASEDWHTPRAVNDLRSGGKFSFRMEAKDGSVGFDFEGTYQQVKKHELIEYTIVGGRKVSITFTQEGAKTRVVEAFEPENENSIELQQRGWQAILDNFKKHAES